MSSFCRRELVDRSLPATYEIVCVLFIVRDQLAIVLGPCHEMVLNKLDESQCVTITLVLEVETLSCLNDTDGLLMSLMLQD